ncbi:MAG: hypothetical protein BWK78_05885, partial [Thiotrichaceae bacterium IS1]
MDIGIIFEVIAVLFIIIVYWGYCIHTARTTAKPTTASGYFIAGRSISTQFYILAATATSFSGWTFISHPGMIYSYGFQVAFISFYAITIPFTGVLFLKRQWMLGKRYGFVTPGDMFAEYFKSCKCIESNNVESNNNVSFDGIRFSVVVVAFLFSILYLAAQFRATGSLAGALTADQIGWWFEIFCMMVLAIVLLLYVVWGGLYGVAYVDRMQVILFTAAMVVIGGIVWYHIGWGELTNGIIKLTQYDYNRVLSPDNYSHYLAIPGIGFQTDVLNAKEDTVGGNYWTGTMLLTFMFALMGIQSSPAFSMWAFSNESPKPFAHQQVLASSLGVGAIMLVFTTIQGLGPHLLGANREFRDTHPENFSVQCKVNQTKPNQNPLTCFHQVMNPVEKTDPEVPTQLKPDPDRLIPQLMLTVKKFEIFEESSLQKKNESEKKVDPIYTISKIVIGLLIGFLAVAALAAIQSTASSYISTASGIITRDFLNKRFATHEDQIKLGKISATIVVIIALFTAALFPQDAIALLGGLAVAYGLQMWPALVGICWWPYLTRQGIIWGLIFGLLVVTITENPGGLFGKEWMRWPWTIHSAGWGIFCNFVVAILVSCFTQNQKEVQNRMKFHKFLRDHASLSDHKKGWIPVAWIVTIGWFILAVGPGAVIGNDLFGNPNVPEEWWGIPSIWTWQILWWILG